MQTASEKRHSIDRLWTSVLPTATDWSGGEVPIAVVNVTEPQTDTDRCRQIGTGLCCCLEVQLVARFTASPIENLALPCWLMDCEQAILCDMIALKVTTYCRSFNTSVYSDDSTVLCVVSK